MLTSIIMNGFMLWVYSIINMIRRIMWHKKNPIEITVKHMGSVKQTEHYRIGYQDQSYEIVAYSDVTRKLKDSVDEYDVLLRWIPGKKTAMLSEYAIDLQSQKGLYTCDIISLISLLVMIVSLVFIGVFSTKTTSLVGISCCLLLVSIVSMIIMSIIKRRYKKPFIAEK